MLDKSLILPLLIALALAAVLWWWSFRRLASLGRWRRILALSLRSMVLLLLVLAIANVQWVRTSKRLSVIYLLDQSLSIPQQQREAMITYVNEAVEQHQREGDRAGVIVFGRDAAIEIPPSDLKIPIPGQIESSFNPENTNLAGAMRLAQATFPEDASKRIVIVSDGNENLGDGLKQAQYITSSGVGIDVVPIDYRHPGEVIVERLSVPGNIRPGQPFDLKVVANNTSDTSGVRTGDIPGRLVVSRRAGNQSVVVSDEHVTLGPGKKVFQVRQQGSVPGSYRFEADFIPDRPEDDAIAQNNQATAITHIHGKGRVLLIEDRDHKGEFDFLVARLRENDLDVVVQASDRMFTGLDELQLYDTVVLANVPREQFTDRQIEMLVHNTEQLGAGLVMLGGPNSFGVGGWTNTAVEEAMPVEFQIKNLKVVPSGGLVLVIDRSGSMSGDKLGMCKRAAIETVKTLGEQDYVGVVVFDDTAEWIVPMTRAKNTSSIIRRISNIGIGGGTNIYPGMRFAKEGLARTKTSMKHMVVLSDGQTTGEGYDELAREIRKRGITISTVAVGDGANEILLGQIARIGQGKFHRVKDPRALPRIFMQEARRIARPLIYRSEKGIHPVIRSSHDMVRGLEGTLPPIHGFVMTTVKDNPLVEVPVISPVPKDARNSTILAGWIYGLGHTAVLTTDSGTRWATDWPSWENYTKLFNQIVRWSMRPSGNTGKFTVTTRTDGEQAEVIVNALDKNDNFLNFLTPVASAVGPELEPIDLKFDQTAPGRYVAKFPTANVGSYFLVVRPGIGYAPIRASLNVPYSREFRDQAANRPLLEEMASMKPKGGEAGKVITAEDGGDEIKQWLSFDTFRRDLQPARSNQPAWHLLALLAAVLFFFDIFIRRVQIHFAWVRPALAAVGGLVIRHKEEATMVETMDRLKNRKAEVDDRLQQIGKGEAADSRAARFETQEAASGGTGAIDEVAAKQEGKPSKKAASPSIASQKPAAEETYTERLLRAKQKVWDQRNKK